MKLTLRIWLPLLIGHRHSTRSTHLSSESSDSSDSDVSAIKSTQHKASSRGRHSKRGHLCTWTFLVSAMLCVFAAVLATGLPHQHGLKDNVYALALKFYAMAASWPPWPVFSAGSDAVRKLTSYVAVLNLSFTSPLDTSSSCSQRGRPRY